MGHQLARAAPAAAVAVASLAIAACGSGGAAAPPPVLDNARDQVEAAATTVALDESADVAADSAETTLEVPAELPPPDPSTFEGANRVVNLWVGNGGETATVDVWGRRTFTNGPLLLAEEVAFGEASSYFSAPPGYSLVIVNAGAGPDGVERAGLLNATVGEQITTVYTNDDPDGAVYAPNWFEHGAPQSPPPPAPGRGLVWLVAPNVRSFSDEMIAALGGDAFYVGDGTVSCRTQRVEPETAPDILGGTQTVELELEPGPAVISLHPWFSADECDQPSAFEFSIDVVADATTMVIVYTRDGASLEALPVPVQPVD